MTAKASALPIFLDNLKANLDTRLAALAVSVPDSTLADVVVSTGPLRFDEAFESIEFDSAELDSDWAAIGNKPREETGTVSGLVWIVKPGAGELVIKEARDRAFYLLDVIAIELRANIGQWRTSQQADSAVRKVALGTLSVSQGALDKGRVCRVLFTLNYDVRLPQ